LSTAVAVRQIRPLGLRSRSVCQLVCPGWVALPRSADSG
jgi:hypothetical protein